MNFHALLQKAVEWKNPARNSWSLPQAYEDRIARIFREPGLTDHQRVGKVYETLLEGRLAGSSTATRWLMRGVVEDALEQRSVYSKSVGDILARLAGPHYNPLVNRTVMPTDAALGARRYLVAIHELEHAHQRNSNPLEFVALGKAWAQEMFMIFRTPITPVMRARIESRAVGAQWELASRIPAEIRRKLVAELKEAPKVLGPVEETSRGLAAVQSLFAGSLVDELRRNLATVGIRNIDPALNRLVTRFLYAEKKGTQPRLLQQVDAAIKSAALPAAEQTKLKEFFAGFFKRRDALLKGEKVAIPRAPALFTATLSEQDQKVYAELLKRRQDTRLGRSMRGQIEQSFNEILQASLENAHLSKVEFVNKVAPIHGYAIKQLAGDHLSLDSGWKAFLAITGAIEVGLAAAHSDDAKKEERKPLAKDLQLLIKLLSMPFEEAAQGRQPGP